MSNTKIRFIALRSSMFFNLVIFNFLVVLTYFSESLWSSLGISIEYKYVFLVFLILIVVTLMSLLMKLTYILISEPYEVEYTENVIQYICYLMDRLFHFTNPKEYAKAVELGMR